MYQILRYGFSVTTPLWIFPYAIVGLVAGLFSRNNRIVFNRKKILLITVIGEALILVLNTFAIYVDSRVYGYYSVPYVWGAVGMRFLIAFIKAVLIGILMPSFLRVMNNNINDLSINERKKRQRKECTYLRQRLSDAEREKKSSAICKRALMLDEIRKAKVLFSYQAMKNEVNINALNQILEREGKTIAYPVVDDACNMDAYVPNNLDAYELGKYGIKAPIVSQSKCLDPSTINVALIPCVGFDVRGRRMGHGAGYYDRYLPLCTNALKIMIAFDAQEMNSIICEDTDIDCDIIITESRTIYNNCNKTQERSLK